MTEPTASPDVTDERLRECSHCGDLGWIVRDDNVFRSQHYDAYPNQMHGFRVECCGACHSMTCWWHTEEQAIEAWNRRAPDLASRQEEVERLTREVETLEGEASIGRLFRAKNELLRASLETAEASLRLATQRREDAHEIAGRLREIVQKGMDHHPDYDTDRQIYGAMHMQVLRLLEWDVSARAALQPKEN